MEFGHWVGMNGDWLAAVNGAGTWFLANVYTKMVVYLTSTITCDIRGSTGSPGGAITPHRDT